MLDAFISFIDLKAFFFNKLMYIMRSSTGPVVKKHVRISPILLVLLRINERGSYIYDKGSAD